MLSNVDLSHLARRFKIPDFRGVFTKDTLPSQALKGAYVINMEDDLDSHGHSNPGTHWVALFISSDGNAAYSDSFGSPPPESVVHFGEHGKKHRRHLAYTSKQLQNIQSDVCGWYAIYFLVFMSRRGETFRNMNDYTDLFDDDVRKNRTILEHLLEDLHTGRKGLIF